MMDFGTGVRHVHMATCIHVCTSKAEVNTSVHSMSPVNNKLSVAKSSTSVQVYVIPFIERERKRERAMTHLPRAADGFNAVSEKPP